MTITVSSTAFRQGEPIPKKYTGDGEDISPPLSWTGLPDGTKQLAIICDDPDAPTKEPWVHWVIYNLPGTLTGLPEAVAGQARLDAPAGALQGKNSWSDSRTIGYRGPAPPPGKVHHYHFRVYALDKELALNPELSRAALEKAIRPHVLAQGELIGTYRR